MGRSERGKRFKRTKKKVEFELTDEDMKYLKENTRYDEEEIREWFSGFKAVCPTGVLDRNGILEMYDMPMKTAIRFRDQIFRLFDKDNTGSVNFREFVLATNMSSCQSAEDKLRWAFRMYDKDGSGTIDMEEMTEIVTTFYNLEGASKGIAMERAETIFKQLDSNGDGSLDEEEFCKGCLEDNDFYQVIQDGVNKLKNEQKS